MVKLPQRRGNMFSNSCAAQPSTKQTTMLEVNLYLYVMISFFRLSRTLVEMGMIKPAPTETFLS
jgi:hypothetical protein